MEFTQQMNKMEGKKRLLLTFHQHSYADQTRKVGKQMWRRAKSERRITEIPEEESALDGNLKDHGSAQGRFG